MGATGENGWAEKIVRDVWPQERDFLERPDRLKYVRKLVPSTGCVFCRAGEPRADAAAAPGDVDPGRLVLARDERVVVLMNKYPYNTGHLLIVPAVHVGDLSELEDRTHARVAWWTKRAMAELKRAFACQGFNVGLNHGQVAGAGIPEHLHWHVIPRWGGDTNFFPLIAETKVLPETLHQTYARLEPLFAAIPRDAT